MNHLSESGSAATINGVAVSCLLTKTVDNKLTACLIQFPSLLEEIIELIFIDCLPEDFMQVAQPNISEAPMLLCHVCNQWRRIAFNSQELWRKLHVRIDILTFTRVVKGKEYEGGSFISPKSQDFLDWWAARGPDSFTLSIEKRWNRPGYWHSDRYRHQTTYHSPAEMKTHTYNEFYTSPFVRSAQNLRLSFHSDDLRMLCANPGSVTYQKLEYLTVHTFIDSIVRYHNWTGFPFAPRLRRLYLSSPAELWVFPSEQLTHLCIPDITVTSLRRILEEDCPNLLFGTFNLRACFEGEFEEAGSRICQVPKLRQLLLVGYISPVLFKFLRSMSFPYLQALRLLLKPGTDNIEITMLLDFLKQAPRVTELHLAAPLFLNFPSEGIAYDTEIERRTIPDVLPKLKILVLEDRDAINPGTSEYFRGLILSRFFRPAIINTSAKVEVVFSRFSNFGGSTRHGQAMVEFDRFIQGHRHSIPSEVVIRYSPTPILAWSQVSRDLSRWDEAMGFYEVVDSPDEEA